MSSTLEDFNPSQEASNALFSEPRASKQYLNQKEKSQLFMTQYNSEKKRFNEVEPNRKQIYELIDSITRPQYTKDNGISIGINESNNTVIKLNEQTQNNEKFLYSISTREFRVPKPPPEKKTNSIPPQLFPIRKNINFVEANLQKQYETRALPQKENLKEIIHKNEEEDLLYKREMISIRKQEKELKRTMIEQEKEERSLMKRQMSLIDKQEPKAVGKESPPKIIRKRVILPISSIFIDANFRKQVKSKIAYLNEDQQLPESTKKDEIPVMHYDELINQLHDILFYNPTLKSRLKQQPQTETKTEPANETVLANKKMESIVLIPKIVTFGDKAPRPINYSEYSENFSAFKVDVLSLIKYLQNHTDESVTIDKLRDILYLVGSPYNEDEIKRIKESLAKERNRKQRLEEIKENAEEDRQNLAEEKLRKTMGILQNKRPFRASPVKKPSVDNSKKAVEHYVQTKFINPLIKNVLREVDKINKSTNLNKAKESEEDDSIDSYQPNKEIELIPPTDKPAPLENSKETPFSRWETTEKNISNINSSGKSPLLSNTQNSQRDIFKDQIVADKKPEEPKYSLVEDIKKEPEKPKDHVVETKKIAIPKKVEKVEHDTTKPKANIPEQTNKQPEKKIASPPKQNKKNPSISKQLKNEQESSIKKQLEEETASLKINQLIVPSQIQIASGTPSEPTVPNEIKEYDVPTATLAQEYPEENFDNKDIPVQTSFPESEAGFNADDIQKSASMMDSHIYPPTLDAKAKTSMQTRVPSSHMLQEVGVKNPEIQISSLNVADSKAGSKSNVAEVNLPPEGTNAKSAEENQQTDDQRKEIMKQQMIKRMQYNKTLRAMKPTVIPVIKEEPKKVEKVEKKVVEEESEEMKLEKLISAHVQEVVRKKEQEAEEAKKVKETEEKEVEEKKKKVVKRPPHVEHIATFLDAIEKERMNQGISQLDDLKTLLLNDNAEDIGTDCDKLLKDFFNQQQFHNFHEATTSIEDKMCFTNQVIPYFNDKDDSKNKEYYDLQEIIKRIQLFMKQNGTIYRTKDMRETSCVYQFPPNNEDALIEQTEAKELSSHKIIEMKTLVAILAELDRRVRMRTKDLKKLEQDQMKAINPSYRMLPSLEKSNSMFPIEQQKETKPVEDTRLPVISLPIPKDKQAHKYKVNAELLKKRQEMSQIEVMERRYQLLTQTKFNKSNSLKAMSCDPSERKLRVAAYKY